MPKFPDDKFKEEVFSNLGGINSKVGLYSNGPMEFQDLSNLDFQRPGALSQRWGSTLYMSQNFSGPISSLYEYVKLDGSSYLIVGTSGALWAGATTGQAQGVSFTYDGSSVAMNFTGSCFNLKSSSVFTGGTSFKINIDGFYYQGNASQDFQFGFAYNERPNLQSDNALSCITFANYMFAADGNKFFKFDGVTTRPVGLPFPSGLSLTAAYGVASGKIGIGYTGLYYFFASYVNERGFESNILPIMAADGPFNLGSSLAGGSFMSATFLLNTPLSQGISSINLYFYYGATSNPDSISTNATLVYNLPYKLLANYPASGSTVTAIPIGTTTGGFSAIFANIGAPPDANANNAYVPLGLTMASSLGGGFFGNFFDNFTQPGYFPRFLELHQNRLFCAGFSRDPSTVRFSDVGEPEGYAPDWNFEVRTNDGDRITGLKDYNSRLYIFKQFSFSELSGDNQGNFFERLVSNQYGSLSNRAIVVYNDIMLFLDAKGVIQFNGAGLQCISGRMQPTFDSINLTAALDKATMVHDKQRNEVLIGIPTNGATVNNVTIVYDYLADAWTKYDGYNPAVYTTAKQRFGQKTAIYGGYSGQVFNFGQSLMGDNGAGFTCYLKTGFHSDSGYTNTKLWRRLWTNVDEVTGATVACNINFFQDYGSSIVLNRTSYLSPFQTRLDFGIAAKSIAFEMSKFSATTMIRYYGHGFAYRNQRSV